MRAGFDMRIYELFNRPHDTVFDELWNGGYGCSFHDVAPEIEVVFQTGADWTTFRLAFGYSCISSEFDQTWPSLTTSVGRNHIEAVINQLSMSNTAIVVERMKLAFTNGRDHDRLQAALDAAVAPAWSARSFSI